MAENGYINPETGDGWTATVDGDGNVIRADVTRSGSTDIYDVEKIPSGTVGGSSTFMLKEQDTNILHGVHEFSDINMTSDSLSLIENQAKQFYNSATASGEQLLYEANKKFGIGDLTAQVLGKAASAGITNTAAANLLGGGVATFVSGLFEEDTPTEVPGYLPPQKTTDDFRVRLRSRSTNEQVSFIVSPNVDEARSATYDSVSPVHHPGAIQVYKSTNARTFNVNGKLISRNEAEATLNLLYLNLVRSWVMPYYGEGTASSPSTKKSIGAPPDVLVLSGYGDQNIQNVPVVLTSYSWTYPDNVDYIPTYTRVPFPTVLDISLMLTETYSPEEFSKFDLSMYKLGLLDKAFGGSPRDQDSGDLGDYFASINPKGNNNVA